MTGQELYLWFGQPFDGVSWASLAGIAVVYFLAFAARGAIGFGAIAPAIVLTSWLIPPHHAVLLAMIGKKRFSARRKVSKRKAPEKRSARLK